MYLIIPLALIFGSLLMIGFIVWRKAPYIKKLVTVEGASLNGNGMPKKVFLFKLFSELSPEAVNSLKSIKLQEYKDTWLVELEKFLRRLRLISLRMDRWSNSWIQGIRKHVDKSMAQTSVKTSEAEEMVTSDVSKSQTKVEEKVNEAELLKREEQRIIIEIARNPKDSKLYGVLGDLYVKMGDYDDAKESYEAAVELDPNNEELKKKLSFALEKIQQN